MLEFLTLAELVYVQQRIVGHEYAEVFMVIRHISP